MSLRDVPEALSNNMMKTFIAISICFALLIQGCAATNSKASESVPLHLADHKYWSGSDENLALEITGKFNSLEEMASTLRLDNNISAFNNRTWLFADILVLMDCNANGDVASWVVSGPKPLISAYVQHLEKLYEQNTLFYDFGYFEIKVTAGYREP